MTAALYDVPGPRARRRLFVATVVASVALAALVVAALFRFAAKGQFAAAIWEPLTRLSIMKFLAFGLLATLRVATVAMVLSSVIGTLLALGRLSRNPLVRWPSTAYVQFFRAVPLVLLILFAALGLPQYGIKLPLGGFLVVGLTLYNSAVMAEIVRAGILSLDRGQSEAAYAVGLTRGQAMTYVIVPQAVRRMLPSLVTQLVTILKDTALGYIIGYEELLRRGQITGEYFTGTLLPAYLTVAVVYILVNLSLSRLAHRLEQRQRRRLGRVATSRVANEDQALLQADEIAASKQK